MGEGVLRDVGGMDLRVIALKAGYFAAKRVPYVVGNRPSGKHQGTFLMA